MKNMTDICELVLYWNNGTKDRFYFLNSKLAHRYVMALYGKVDVMCYEFREHTNKPKDAKSSWLKKIKLWIKTLPHSKYTS